MEHLYARKLDVRTNFGSNEAEKQEVTDGMKFESLAESRAFKGKRTIGLEHLPVEILQQIIRLAVTPCCSCAEWKQSRRRCNLRNNPFALPKARAHISLVSKTLLMAARPIEYETVYLSHYSPKGFAELLSDSSKVAGRRVEAHWVRRLVVRFGGENSVRLELVRELVAIFNICTRVHTIKLTYADFHRRIRGEDGFQPHLLSLWNAMPKTLRNLFVFDQSLIPQMSPPEKDQFTNSHHEISRVYFGYSECLGAAKSLNLFPQLSGLDLGDTMSSLSEWNNQPVVWSSLTWLRFGYIYTESIAGFWSSRYDSLVSLEVGRSNSFDSQMASLLFLAAPNLEELQYTSDADIGDFEVGWGTYNGGTGRFVKHHNLKHIEVISTEWKLRDWGSDPKSRVAVEAKQFCDDFRGLTANDFPSLTTLDVFIDSYYGRSCPGFDLAEVLGILQEESEVKIGAVIDSKVQLRVLVNQPTECSSQLHYDDFDRATT